MKIHGSLNNFILLNFAITSFNLEAPYIKNKSLSFRFPGTSHGNEFQFKANTWNLTIEVFQSFFLWDKIYLLHEGVVSQNGNARTCQWRTAVRSSLKNSLADLNGILSPAFANSFLLLLPLPAFAQSQLDLEDSIRVPSYSAMHKEF